MLTPNAMVISLKSCIVQTALPLRTQRPCRHRHSREGGNPVRNPREAPLGSLSLEGRGLAARSQRAAERLMQQRLFQRNERGEFLLVEGFEALGFGFQLRQLRHD